MMKKQKNQLDQLTVNQAYGAKGAEIASRIMMGLVMVMAAATPCFADVTDAGQNFGGWVQEQALYIGLAVVAVTMIGFILKKAWIPAAIFIIIAAVIIAIVAAPETLQTFGQSLLTRFTQ